MHPWLRRLQHDLVKRAVWPARDLRDKTAAPSAADLRALRSGLHDLIDAEGKPIDARSLWEQLRELAPADAPLAALDRFGAALAAAQTEVASLDGDPGRCGGALQALLAVEAAFDGLARSMNH